jgi:hypothetical protein
MPAVPLGLKSYKRGNAFQPEVELVNLVIEEDESGASPDKVMRIQRPGLVDSLTLSGRIRGIEQTENVLNGDWFGVHGGTFSRVYPSYFDIGTVAGSDPVAFAATFDAQFTLAGGIVYRWDGVAFTTIALPGDFDGYPVDIETLNSYLIIACNTGRFYWLAPGSVIVDPLDFATAESSPDGLKSVRRLVDELFFGGTISIEPWQPTGELDAPFQKAGGRQFERGVLARDTMRRFDNSLLWVGDDGIVYRVGSVPTRVSDFGIEERLRKRSGDPSAWTFGADGHKYYALRIPGQGTFVFDASSGQWSEFRTQFRAEWAPYVGASSPSMTLAGDDTSGKIWRVDPGVALDGTLMIERRVTGSVPMTGRGPRNDSFSLGIGCSEDCAVNIRWKDGNDDYPAFAETLQAEAGANILNLYRLGAFDKPFRTFEVSITDPGMIRISGALVNEAWQ